MQQSAHLSEDTSRPLRLLVEHVPMAIALLDSNLRYLLVSRRWLADYGLEGYIIGMSHYELLPELPEHWKALYQRCLTGTVEQCEDLLTRSDGKTDWIKWEARPWYNRPGEIGGLLVFSEIITEQKQIGEALKQAYGALDASGSGQIAELTKTITALQTEVAECRQAMRALRDRNKLLQLVLDSLPQTIFWKDRNSIYQGCNRRFAEDAGIMSPENIIGKTDYELAWTKEEADTFREFDRRVMGQDLAEMHVIEPPSVRNEQQGWVETSKIPLHDHDGNVIGILGTYEDITERAKEEDALRQSEAQLRRQAQQLEQTIRELQQTQLKLLQSEKMSSLGQLVAGVAHEINNPVGFIQGNVAHANQYIHSLLSLLDLYQREYPDPSPIVQAKMEDIDLEFLKDDLFKVLASMRIGADRICEIVRSLRNFSRHDEAEVKDVDIHEGLDSTLMILQNRLKASPNRPAIQVIKHYGDLPKVECYAGQLNQVFMNILVNAIDALEETIKANSRKASHHSATSQTAHPESRIQIYTNAPTSDRIVIRIADNGPGMTENVQQRLFDPFFTTKPIGKGTGLGMSISYQIVTDKHGGTLRCISAPAQGTEFVIEIPTQIRAKPKQVSNAIV